MTAMLTILLIQKFMNAEIYTHNMKSLDLLHELVHIYLSNT